LFRYTFRSKCHIIRPNQNNIRILYGNLNRYSWIIRSWELDDKDYKFKMHVLRYNFMQRRKASVLSPLHFNAKQRWLALKWRLLQRQVYCSWKIISYQFKKKLLVPKLILENIQFHNYFRMTATQLEKLLGMIRSKL